MKRLSALFLGLFLVAGLASADTFVGGEIETQMWTPEGSPYILESDVIVLQGATLTIAPGVEVRGMPATLLKVFGAIHANGAPDQPILFTNHADALWDGIEINDTDEPSSFSNCIFESAGTFHDHANGGAFNIRQCNVVFEDCTFRFNRADHNSSALHAYDAEVTFVRSVFHDNIADNAGTIGGDGGAHMEILHCLIADNHAEIGTAITFYPGEYVVDHCTIAGNMAEDPEGASTFYSTVPVTITNSIIVSPQGGNMNNNNQVEVSYACLSDDQLPGDNIIIADPMFVNPMEHDFHLLPDSPCIDAGDPDFPHDPDGSITDLGYAPFDGEPGPEPPVLALPHLAAVPGHPLGFPLIIDHTRPPMHITSVQVLIQLPFEYLLVDDVLPAPGGPIHPDGGWMYDWNLTDEGLLISMAGPQPLDYNGPLVNIVTMVDEGAPVGEDAPLLFAEAMLNEGEPPVETMNGGVFFTDIFFGDVSMNGDVTAFDASMILSFLAGGMDLNEQQRFAGDVTGNGELTPFDASLILAYTVGNIDEFPVEGGPMQGVGSGDPVIPEEIAVDDGVLNILVQLENASDVFAAGLTISYDNSLLTLTDVTSDNPSVLTMFQPTVDGSRIMLSGPDAMSGNVDLLWLHFATAGLPAETAVTFNRLVFNEYGIRNDLGETIVTPTLDVEEDSAVPLTHGVVSAYPNPFNPETRIQVDLLRADRVRIVIFDTLGRQAAVLADANFGAGVQSFNWNASGLAAGTYYTRITIGSESRVIPLTLIK